MTKGSNDRPDKDPAVSPSDEDPFEPSHAGGAQGVRNDAPVARGGRFAAIAARLQEKRETGRGSKQ
ncbi:hypothetical protein [Mesorhizobium sp. BHbdii]